jgi:hypothetical protein
MTVQLLFGTSVAFGFVAWAVVATLYIWPQLSTQSRIDALRPLLVLHAFRFIGLAFLVPGGQVLKGAKPGLWSNQRSLSS